MVKESLVTITQARTLKKLGFNESTPGYFWEDWRSLGIDFATPENSNHIKNCVSVPTTDEVIDWLRRKYNVVIYNKVEPFVDPTDDSHKKILFKYGVKRCDVNHLGWNGRIDLGTTRLSTNVYSLKREAIGIALKYIKSQNK